MALIWQVSVSQASRNAISELQEDSTQFTAQQKSDPLFPSGWPSEAFDAHLCREDSEQLNIPVCIYPDDRATPSGHYSVFEKNLDFLFRHGSGRQLTIVWMIGQHRLDGALIRKRVKHVMERRLEFIVQTLSAYVRLPPRELWISVEIGFLKPINRGF